MENCIFCKIARGEMEAKLVKKQGKCLAFDDIAPQAPVHTLVIPLEHIADAREAVGKGVYEEMFTMARQVAEEKGIAEPGFRLVINCGAHGGQAVGHLHLHVLGGRQMNWPPG